MNAIAPLVFDNGKIRVILIGNEPFFVGRDVCEELGYADHTNAIKQHCRGVVIHHPIIDALGRQQPTRLLSEGDLMRLIVNSKMHTAERFERMIFDEILPTIRRTGQYGAPADEVDLDDPAVLHNLLLKHTAQNLELRRRVEIMKPQVATLHHISRQEGEFSLRDCAKMLKLKPKKLVAWLLEIRWLYRSEPGDELRPYQARIDSGHMMLRRGEKQLPGGKTRAISQALVTSKGHIKLGHLLNGG